MLKKVLSVVLVVLMCTTVCACGGNDKTSGTESATLNNGSAAASTGSDGTTSVEELADATLTISVKKGDITAFKSDRAYDSSKEDITLILVTGQSNFTASVGYRSEYTHYLSGKTEVIPEAPLLPLKGTVYSGNTVTELTDACDVSNLADATSKKNTTMGGVSPAFGMEWYAITGTKVVFVQAARGAVGVHEWVPNPEDYYCTCNNNGGGTLYSSAVANYKTSYNALSQKYNIVYTGYIWNQGEHENGEYADPTSGATVCSDETWYQAYKSMHDGFMEELDLDFGGISVVRHHQNGYSSATDSNKLTIARNAQYKLCNDIDNLFMLSTISETTSSDVMDQSNNIHYSQMIFNQMGVEMADNLACYLGVQDKKAEFSGVKVSTEAGLYIAEFDASGASVTGEPVVVKKGPMTSHILAKLSTLGTGYTISGLSLSVKGDTGNFIDEYGAIDWSAVADQKISDVEIKCVIE